MRRRDTQDFFELRVALTTDETFPAIWCLSSGDLDAHAQRVAPSVAHFFHLTSIWVTAWVDRPRTAQHGANCERRSMPDIAAGEYRRPRHYGKFRFSSRRGRITSCGKPCRTCDKTTRA